MKNPNSYSPGGEDLPREGHSFVMVMSDLREQASSPNSANDKDKEQLEKLRTKYIEKLTFDAMGTFYEPTPDARSMINHQIEQERQAGNSVSRVDLIANILHTLKERFEAPRYYWRRTYECFFCDCRL